MKMNSEMQTSGFNAVKSKNGSTQQEDVQMSYPTLSAMITDSYIGRQDYSYRKVESKAKPGVVFVLGENEELVGLKSKPADADSPLNMSNTTRSDEISDLSTAGKRETEVVQSTSAAAPIVCRQATECQHKHKKHSGVKFNFEQYPQIATNYMRSKNLDISNEQFLEKGIRMEREQFLNTEFSGSSSYTSKLTEECDCCRGTKYQLQTPCNASELEFTSDLIQNGERVTEMEQHAKEKVDTPVSFVRKKLEQTVIRNSDLVVKEQTESDAHAKAVSSLNEDVNFLTLPNANSRHVTPENKYDENKRKIKNLPDDNWSKEINIIKFPLPKSRIKIKQNTKLLNPGFSPSLMGGITDHYVSDFALQGTIATPDKWENVLRRDLSLCTHSRALMDTDISESICIIGDLNKLEVRLVSSQTYVLSNSAGSGMVGMSQLVSSMLEAVLEMWRLRTPTEHCLMYLENKLHELYLKSESLADLLLTTDFCELAQVTSTLGVEVTDVPLLLSIASTHSPQVTKKYGLSFR